MEYDGYVNGGNSSDDSDDEELMLAFAAFILAGLALFDPYINSGQRRRIRDSAQSGPQYVIELINGHRDRIFDNLRMEAPLFRQLCDLLVQRDYWVPHPTQRVGIHESVAICLLCLSHNERHRVLADRFQHSPETTDRHLRRCLRSLVRLGRDLVRQDCVGAIDGAHVSAWCTAEDRERYRNRHGKYYTVDAAYQNMPGFMAPFKGARGTAQERAVRILFNKRHASLRNIIERTFGVLKKRFPILKGPMQNYMMATQNNIVLACMALHNFMREYVPNDAYFAEEEADIALADNINPFNPMPAAQGSDMSAAGIAEWNESRRAIADMMYYYQHQ
ncbi:uncharacterized protein [Coffea arabica]|uniref:Nuclease HARBI1 n=1 Tax=Coffea arabica TaxID=13443 RepID=A0A6P6VLM8_COFAR|nr:uncharacterized protein LOC113724686 [Coffea arabica]